MSTAERIGTDPDNIAARHKLTPMLQQYIEAKKEAPDCLLLFRMGDFYELFFEDAQIAARELDLTLTARDKGPDAIPMAGVPHHAINNYLARLVERGYGVAICDQIEDPRFAKGIVKREITRLVTPGTVSDLEALEPGSRTYLGYVAELTPCASSGPDAAETAASRQQMGARAQLFIIAVLDLLAGELLCTYRRYDELADELQRMGVREVLCEPMARETLRACMGGQTGIALRATAGEAPDDAAIRADLRQRFATDQIESLAGGGGAQERLAVARLVAYAETTQRRQLKHLMPPRAYRVTDFLVVDEATRRNLELLSTQVDGRSKGSLRWHLDRCRSAMGSRLLTQWLLFPLRDAAAIGVRQDSIAALTRDRLVREEAQCALEGVRDIERLVGRITVGRANPRDLVALGLSLERVAAIKQHLGGHASPLGGRWAAVDAAADVCALLQAALQDDAPVTANEGGVFRRGYRDDLDALIALSTEGHDYLADLERRERERSGIASLKVRYNRVFGYYIEITKANLAQAPADYIRKQTLVGAERFITEELKDFEHKILTADERRKAREAALFEELVQQLAGHTNRLRAISRLIAETDVLASLAQVADEGRYVRPELVDEPIIELRESRHPVLERLMPGGERFVPNDLSLDARDRQLMIVTGPNMSGKSTVMRQAALCVLLAQIGSFVPARAARIGLCDRLFTRVGAADNLSRGQSTFMVEMTETATILRDATERSLILLDEIGRGTSTYDGVSIAWAVAEHVHDTLGARAMFATHYHELTKLAELRPRIVNASVAVKELGGKVVFLRQLVEQPANRSYGIQVARLAGLPESVLVRAREILAQLEQGDMGSSRLASVLPHAPHAPHAPPAAACGGGAVRGGHDAVCAQIPLFAIEPAPGQGASAQRQRQQRRQRQQ